MKVILWLIAAACIGVVLVIAGLSWTGVSAANAREAHQRAVRATTENHERMLAEIARQRKLQAEALSGDTVSTPPTGHQWPCAPDPSDLPHLMRLIIALDDERTPDSLVNTYTDAVVRAKALSLRSRTYMKVLKTKPGLREVQILRQVPFRFEYQRVAAEGCWISSAAIGAPQ
jgi:hypothetical protein